MPKEESAPVPQINYSYVGNNKKNLESLEKVGKIFTPNKRMINSLIFIFISVLIIAAINFPYGIFMTGNTGASFEVGYPFVFANIQISGENGDFFIDKILFDFLIWLALSYFLNILLNLLGEVTVFEKRKIAIGERPTLFKDRSIATSEKLASKVTGQDNKN